LTVEECIEEGVACAQAGAAIVHVHAMDPELDDQNDDPNVYAEIIDGIRDQVDAIVYPTIPPANAPDQPRRTGEERFAHQDELGSRDRLEWSVVDPGSVNFNTYDAVSRQEHGFIYENPEDHIHVGLQTAERHRSSPAYAIYEPGFVRLGAALADQYSVTGPIYRFMFSEMYTFGYPPKQYALESYLNLLEAEAPDAPWMVAGLGVDITSLIEPTVERGGHIRVGLEDAPLGSERSNVEWVKNSREQIQDAGGELATPQEVRASLEGK
jgi:uncharacterized protein (DUF849 family)